MMRLPPSLGTRWVLPLLRWFYLVFAAQAAVYTFAAWWMRIPYAQVAGVLLSTVIFASAWRHTCYMQSCLTRWARRPGHRPL